MPGLSLIEFIGFIKKYFSIKYWDHESVNGKKERLYVRPGLGRDIWQLKISSGKMIAEDRREVLID